VLESVEAVCRVLQSAGHDVRRVAVRDDLVWLEAVRHADAVFNLCEGVGGVSRLEYPVAAAIELTGVPYTGASPWTMTICHRKPVLNAVLQAEGLPVPGWTVAGEHDAAPECLLPAIVKPAAEDASIGIEQGSVVATPEALDARIRDMRARHGLMMVQAYVPGREFNVGFVGDHVLPISEIDFAAMPDDAWPIVSFSAKWHADSAEYAGTQPVCPAAIDEAYRARLVDVASAAWRAVEGTGYGRVDLRVDRDGQPWILEVNPNPDLSTDAGLANMARVYGWDYGELVLTIVETALRKPAAAAGLRSMEVA
jgi:D-alanine-D-alanine ligase